MLAGWLIYIIWALLVLGWLIVAAGQLANRKFSRLNFFALIPVSTIVLFSYVFIFNPGSNIVQFTDRQDLFGFWVDCYMPLFWLNSIGGGVFLIALFAAILGKHPSKASGPLKLTMFMSMALSLLHLLVTVPLISTSTAVALGFPNRSRRQGILRQPLPSFNHRVRLHRLG